MPIVQIWVRDSDLSMSQLHAMNEYGGVIYELVTCQPFHVLTFIDLTPGVSHDELSRHVLDMCGSVLTKGTFHEAQPFMSVKIAADLLQLTVEQAQAAVDASKVEGRELHTDEWVYPASVFLDAME